MKSNNYFTTLKNCFHFVDRKCNYFCAFNLFSGQIRRADPQRCLFDVHFPGNSNKGFQSCNGLWCLFVCVFCP